MTVPLSMLNLRVGQIDSIGTWATTQPALSGQHYWAGGEGCQQRPPGWRTKTRYRLPRQSSSSSGERTRGGNLWFIRRTRALLLETIL